MALRVEPVEDVQACEAQGRPTARRVQCGCCSRTYCETAVVDSEAMPAPESGGELVMRRLYCSHCGHIQAWREHCYQRDGERVHTGQVAWGPVWRRGWREVRELLRLHPQARGVI